MADAFKIGEGYVEITSRVDRDQIAKDAQRAGDDAGDSFGDKFDKAAKERTDDTGESVGKKVGKGTTRESKKAGKDSGEGWADEFEKALAGPRRKKKKGDGPKHNDDGPGFLSGFTKALRKSLAAVFSPATTMTFVKGLAGVLMSPPVIATVVAGAASLGTLVASGLAASLMVALPAALSGGLLYLGVFMLRTNKTVVKAAKKMKKNFNDAFATGTENLIGPLVESIKILDQLITTMRPTISALFQIVGFALIPLSKGLSGFMVNLAPGLLALTRLGTDGLVNLGNWLPTFGTILSNWFLTIQKNWPAIKQSFGEFFKDFGTIVGLLAAGLLWLATNYGKIKSIMGTILGMSNPVVAAVVAIYKIFKWLYDVLVGHSIVPDLVNGIIRWFSILPGKIVGFIGNMVRRVISWFATLATNVRARVTGMINSVVSWFSGLPGKAGRAVSRLWASMSGAFSNARSAAVERTRALVNGAIQVLSNLAGRARNQAGRVKGAITGAFANAGSWLANAGRRIISGLIGGIRGMIGSLRGTLGGITNMIPDWKGPADRDAVLLKPAGESVMDGFMSGIESRIGGLRRQLGGITAGMPDMAVAGVPAAAPAASGAGLTIGSLTVHIKGVLNESDPVAYRALVVQLQRALDEISRSRRKGR